MGAIKSDDYLNLTEALAWICGSSRSESDFLQARHLLQRLVLAGRISVYYRHYGGGPWMMLTSDPILRVHHRNCVVEVPGLTMCEFAVKRDDLWRTNLSD